jgi:hypothetical protein
MPQNLLSEYTVVYVARGEDFAPPYVSLTRDQGQADREALAWARQTFGDGEYRVVGGRVVGSMQSRSWGQTGYAP